MDEFLWKLKYWCWQSRKVVYKIGLRPKPGSFFYSPSLSILYGIRAALKKRVNPFA